MPSTAFLTIAYVTALLKSLIEHGLVRNQIADLVGGVAVSPLPPDHVGAGPDEQARLNLFLSHIAPNTRVRSLDPRARPADPPAAAPLALDLHYIITAYSAKELQIETLLGYVSALLRERPCLALVEGNWCVYTGETTTPEKIDAPAIQGASADLPELIGSIGIRPQFPNADALSKVWSALQVKYRPSLSYKVEIQPESTTRPATMATLDLQRAR
ncbi:MAG: DUF4255 domain-containing protein [Kouleothrix sp.]|nr:DUF4255 domain-containing protein [Kouleothrix sp.]